MYPSNVYHFKDMERWMDSNNPGSNLQQPNPSGVLTRTNTPPQPLPVPRQRQQATAIKVSDL